MYKLKNSYIDKIIENKISSKEIDFLLHISLSQDEYGVVGSVYYKSVCEKIGISYQKFYDILEHLQEIGLIFAQKINRMDYTIKLIGNDFSEANRQSEDPSIGSKAFGFGYLKVGGYDFECDRFSKLKAGAKLLFLYYQRFTSGKHMLLKNFYDDHSALLGVTPRSLQTYLKELSDARLLGVGRSRNKAYNYEINLRCTKTLDKSRSMILPTENDVYKSNIEDMIRINFRSNLPEDPGIRSKALKDISAMTDQSRCKKDRHLIQSILTAIKRSLTLQRDEGKKRPILNAPLVNKCLTELYMGTGGVAMA